MNSNFSQIRLLTMNLAAIERQKFDVPTFSPLLMIRSFYKVGGNKDMHNITDEFEYRPDRTTD